MFGKSILPYLMRLILELEDIALKMFFWLSSNLPPLSTVKHVIILCSTNNLCKDPPNEIVDSIATASVIEKTP